MDLDEMSLCSLFLVFPTHLCLQHLSPKLFGCFASSLLRLRNVNDWRAQGSAYVHYCAYCQLEIRNNFSTAQLMYSSSYSCFKITHSISRVVVRGPPFSILLSPQRSVVSPSACGNLSAGGGASVLYSSF